jgi:Arc/MetJ-type ribon-helix-helix transcriptional regulator
MLARKLAVTVPGDLVDLATREVKTGRAKSLSSFMTEAVREKLARDELKDILAQLNRDLGPPSRKEQAWAEKVITRALQKRSE